MNLAFIAENVAAVAAGATPPRGACWVLALRLRFRKYAAGALRVPPHTQKHSTPLHTPHLVVAVHVHAHEARLLGVGQQRDVLDLSAAHTRTVTMWACVRVCV
jgi:hypothetical protein